MRERRFFGQRIEVVCERDAAGVYLPVRFVLEERALEITEILRRWHDHGFHPATRRRSWLERRHRTFYRVRADDGCTYDLYVDRTGGRRTWFVVRRASRGNPGLTPQPANPIRTAEDYKVRSNEQ